MATMRWVGQKFASEFDFPKDDGSTGAEQLAFLSEQWHLLQNEMNDRHGDNYHDKFCDVNIWTAVKNRPENPPPNLIVLATRNVDPSSLRTRFTEEDMQKHIRFDGQFEPPPNMPILKKCAVVVYADGNAHIMPVVSPASRKRNETTYDSIYKWWMSYYDKEAFFDLTTNLVNGLQVKYLTPEGVEVVPTND